jgi:hypothetical protein
MRAQPHWIRRVNQARDMSLWVALASANLRRDLAAVRAFQKHTTEPDEGGNSPED